jgi:hypothetical protein
MLSQRVAMGEHVVPEHHMPTPAAPVKACHPPAFVGVAGIQKIWPHLWQVASVAMLTKVEIKLQGKFV